MASARRLPTSYNTSTYGNATRDYTSLAAWEAATDNDLVTAAKGEVLECYSDSTTFDDQVEISGATTNADYFRVIKAASGHKGTPSSGVRFELSRNYNGALKFCNILESYFHVQDIAVKVTNSSTGGTTWAIGIQTLGNLSYVEVVGCVLYELSCGSSAENGVRGLAVINATNCKIVDCAVIDTGRDGDFGTRGNIVIYAGAGYSTTNYVYNCTSLDGTYGINIYNAGNAVTCYAKNCIFQDNTTNIKGTGAPTFNQTTNVTSGVTFGTDGYHLSSSDTGAKGQGTDLSSDSIFAFDDDIDIETITGTWSIGCDWIASTTTFIPRMIMIM